MPCNTCANNVTNCEVNCKAESGNGGKKRVNSGGKRGKIGFGLVVSRSHNLWFNVDPSYTKGSGEQKTALRFIGWFY